MTTSPPKLDPRRKLVITGTDSAKILNCSPYGKPISVFNRKLGYEPEDAPGEHLHWGNVLEGVIADEFATRRNLVLVDPGFMVHPKHDWFGGTPDRLVDGKEEGVEIKTSGIWRKDDWGEQGTDEVPQEYIIQCQHYMALTGYPVWHLPVLIGGNEYREYVCEEDKELQAFILEEDEKFYKNHILTKVPPEIDGSLDSKTYLHARFPRESETIRQATPEETKHMQVLKSAKEQVAMLEQVIETEKNLLKNDIGPGTGLFNNQDKITWKCTKDSLKTDWKGVANSFRIHYPEQWKELYSRHTVEKKGVRRFLAQFKE